MAYIKNLPHDRSDATSEEPHQTCLYETLETFVGDHDWAKKARKALSDGDCKVSPTVSLFKVNQGADRAIPRTILFGRSLPQTLLKDSVSLVSKDKAQMECFSRLSDLLETRGSSMQGLEQSAHETDVVLEQDLTVPLIQHCVRALASMSPLIDSQDNPETNTRLIDGFNVLELTRMMWAAGIDPDYVATEIMRVLRHLVAPKLYNLYRTLAALFGVRNWMQYDVDTLSDKTKAFTKSVVAWVYVVGPQNLALGWKKGNSTLDVLLDMEQSWISQASPAQTDAVSELGDSLRKLGSAMQEVIAKGKVEDGRHCEDDEEW